MPEVLNTITTFAIAPAIFIVGLFVYLNNKQSVSHRLFALFSLSVSAWIVSNYLTLFFYNQEEMLFWVRTNMALGVLQGITFFLFAHTFPSGKIILSRRKRASLFLFSTFTIVICYTPLLFSQIQVVDQFTAQTVIGFGMIPFVINSIGLLIWGLILLIKKFVASEGIQRYQSGYIVVGAGLMFCMQIIFNFVLILLFDNSKYVILGAIDTLPFIALTSYAITRYRFMDIKVLLKKSAVYGATLLCSVALYVYLLWLVYTIVSSVVVWIASLLIYTLLWNLFSRKLKYALDRLFFMDELDLSKRIDERLHKLNSTYELETFVIELIRSIEDTVHTQVHSMYIAEREHNHFRLYYPHGERGSISFDDEFVGALNKMSSIVIKDEIGLQHSNDNQRIVKELKKHDAAVILQIQKDHAPIGIIFIGSKKDQKPYLSNEIRELQHVITNAQQQLFAVIQYHEALEGARKTIHEASYSMANQDQSI